MGREAKSTSAVKKKTARPAGRHRTEQRDEVIMFLTSGPSDWVLWRSGLCITDRVVFFLSLCRAVWFYLSGNRYNTTIERERRCQHTRPHEPTRRPPPPSETSERWHIIHWQRVKVISLINIIYHCDNPNHAENTKMCLVSVYNIL